MAVCGGFTNVRDPEEEDQHILDCVKNAVEQRLGKSQSQMRALKVSTQVVAGVNYLFKVRYDDGHAVVKVHKPLPHTELQPFLLAMDHGDHVTEDSPLVIPE